MREILFLIVFFSLVLFNFRYCHLQYVSTHPSGMTYNMAKSHTTETAKNNLNKRPPLSPIFCS